MYKSFREEYGEAFNQYKEAGQYHSEAIKRIVRLKQSTTKIMTKDDLDEIINNYNQEVLSKLIAISVVKINEEKEEVPSNSIEEISKKIAVALVKSNDLSPVEIATRPPPQLPLYKKTQEEIQLIKTIVVAASEAKHNHSIDKDEIVSPVAPVTTNTDNENTSSGSDSNLSEESIWKLYNDHFNSSGNTTVYQMQFEVTTDDQIKFIQKINDKINNIKRNNSYLPKFIRSNPIKKFLTEKDMYYFTNTKTNKFKINLLRLSIYYNHYYIVKYLIGEEIDGSSIDGSSIDETFQLEKNFFKMTEKFNPIENIVKIDTETEEKTPVKKFKLTLRELAIKECIKIETGGENIIDLLIEEEINSKRYSSYSSDLSSYKKTKGGVYHSLIINAMVLTSNIKYIKNINKIIKTLEKHKEHLIKIDKYKTNPNKTIHGPIIQLIGNYFDVAIKLRKSNNDPEFSIFQTILNFFANNLDINFNNSEYMQVAAEKCNLKIIKIIANEASRIHNLVDHPIFIKPAKHPECSLFCRENYPLVRSIKTLRDYEIIEYFLNNSPSILNKYVSNYGIKMAKSYYLYTPVHLIIKLYDKLYDKFNSQNINKTPLDLIKNIDDELNYAIIQKTDQARFIGGIIYDNNISPIRLAEKYIKEDRQQEVIDYLRFIIQEIADKRKKAQEAAKQAEEERKATEEKKRQEAEKARREAERKAAQTTTPEQSKSSISQQGFLRIPKELSDLYFNFKTMLQDHEVIETPFNDKYSKLNKLERNRLNLLYKLIETYENTANKAENNKMNELITLIKSLINNKLSHDKIKELIEKALNIHNEFDSLINNTNNHSKLKDNKSFMYIIYFLHNATM